MNDVSALTLRVTLPPEKPFADRASLFGANGTGKSTLANFLLYHFHEDYNVNGLPPRILVLDTKPRWRAQWLADGTSAKRRYRKMAEGDTIPGAMVLDKMADWDLVWDRDVNPSQTVIAQRLNHSQANAILFCVLAAEKFFITQDARRPSLIYFDEGMDFFHASAAARGTDVVQRCYRAGREKRLATLLGAQRPVGINLQILTEMSYCALFRINFRRDVRRLYEMGWPLNVMPPGYSDPPGTFRLWRDITGYEAPKYRLTREAA